jgi:restriction system protein
MSGSNNAQRRWDSFLSHLSWPEFEQLIARYYREQGFRVEQTGIGAFMSKADGGIDLKLYREAEYLLVQCKYWHAKQVSHNAAFDLIDTMDTQHASGAILVTGGEFTSQARQRAIADPRLELVDGHMLRLMIGPVEDDQPAIKLPSAATMPPPVACKAPVKRRVAASDSRRPLVMFLVFIVVAGLLIVGARVAIGTLQAHVEIPKVEPLPPPPPDPVIVPEPTPQAVPIQPPAPPPRASEDTRQSEKKSEDAMKILEKTTREI